MTPYSTVSASPAFSKTYETAPATEKPDIPTAFRCPDDLRAIIVDDADTRIGVSPASQVSESSTSSGK